MVCYANHNVSGSLREEIIKKAPWLTDQLGFQIKHHEYDGRHMGNSLVVLASETLVVKFVRDKTRIEVSVAPASEPGRWYDLGLLWAALTGDSPGPELVGWAWFFRNHLVEITEALGPRLEETRISYEQKRASAQAAMMDYAFQLRCPAHFPALRSTSLFRLLMGRWGGLSRHRLRHGSSCAEFQGKKSRVSFV